VPLIIIIIIIIIIIMSLFVAHTLVDDKMINKLDIMWKEAVVIYCKVDYYPGICLQGVGYTTTSVSG
jgi:hypothetical protein